MNFFGENLNFTHTSNIPCKKDVRLACSATLVSRRAFLAPHTSSAALAWSERGRLVPGGPRDSPARVASALAQAWSFSTHGLTGRSCTTPPLTWPGHGEKRESKAWATPSNRHQRQRAERITGALRWPQRRTWNALVKVCPKCARAQLLWAKLVRIIATLSDPCLLSLCVHCLSPGSKSGHRILSSLLFLRLLLPLYHFPLPLSAPFIRLLALNCSAAYLRPQGIVWSSRE